MQQKPCVLDPAPAGAVVHPAAPSHLEDQTPDGPHRAWRHP